MIAHEIGDGELGDQHRVTTVALDGRGAERGPETIVAGARAAAADGIALRVFGDPTELGDLEGVEGVEVIAAPGEITNDEEPVGGRARDAAGVGRAAPPPTSPRAARRRWSAPARPGRR